MNIDIDKVVKAVETDAGQAVPGLRESLIEMKSGQFAEVHKPEQILVRAARNKLGLSQPKFAELIDTPVATVRDWEQGRFEEQRTLLVNGIDRCDSIALRNDYAYMLATCPDKAYRDDPTVDPGVLGGEIEVALRLSRDSRGAPQKAKTYYTATVGKALGKLPLVARRAKSDIQAL